MSRNEAPGTGSRAGGPYHAPRGAGTALTVPARRADPLDTGCPPPLASPAIPGHACSWSPTAPCAGCGCRGRSGGRGWTRRTAPTRCRADAELRRGGWDLLVWAAGRAAPAREALALPGAPPVLLVMDATKGAAARRRRARGGVRRRGARGRRPRSWWRARGRSSPARRRRREAEATAVGLRELTDGSRDLLARLAPDGTVLFASGAARHILGHDPERLPGTERPGPLPRRGAGRRRPRRSATTAVAWCCTACGAGTAGGCGWRRPCRRSLDPSGRLVEVRIDARDVTERRDAESERGGPGADHGGGGGRRGPRRTSRP